MPRNSSKIASPKSILLALAVLAALVSCHSRMNPKDLDRVLKNDKQNGFIFQSKPTANSWILAFQGPGMKQGWSVIVAASRAPGVGKNGGSDLVSIGTTLWRGKQEPSKEVMSYLLLMNGVDHNVGSLSLFKERDEWFVQYFTRIPLVYLTREQLVFSVGFVGGFADAVSEKLKGTK